MQRISIPILIRGLFIQTCNPWLIICQCLAILAATVVVALILARYASNRWLGDRQAVKCGFVGLSVIYALLLFGTFGFTPYTVRGILLCLILLTASYSDLRSREVDDHLSVMVLLTVPTLLTRKLGRWQGILLLCIYAAFCLCQFVL